MGAVFITATGTEIGKTYVAAGLIRQFRRAGQAIHALKPVVSGYDPAQPEASDPGQLLAALGKPVTIAEIDRIAPWRFAAPLAPDMAARREGRRLDFDAVVAFSRRHVRDSGVLLVEGIGGIMVPLDDRHTVLDWMVALGAPVLLVAGSYLGSISHTLTCLDVLRRRTLVIRAVVINETAGSTVGLADTIETVTRFGAPIPVIGLPRDGSLGERVFEKIALLL